MLVQFQYYVEASIMLLLNDNVEKVSVMYVYVVHISVGACSFAKKENLLPFIFVSTRYTVHYGI